MKRPLWFVLLQARHGGYAGVLPVWTQPIVVDHSRSERRARRVYKETRSLWAPEEARMWIAREVPAPKKRKGGREK